MPAVCPAPPPQTKARCDRLVSLRRLRSGQSGVVRRVVGRPEDVHRLEEFGLCEGTRLEMFRQGSPCILRLLGGKVCLRAHRSLEILVAPVGDNTSIPSPLAPG